MILASKQTDTGLLIVMEAVGCKKEDVTVETKPGGVLIVSMEENAYYNKRSRSIRFTENYDIQKTRAVLENGVLSLDVPYKKGLGNVKIVVE